MGILTRQLGDPPKLPKVIGVAKMCSAVIFDRISMPWMICGSQESNAEYMKLVKRRLPHIRKEPRMVEHSNGSSGGFGSSMLVHGFQSHGGTPNHPVVMDDHDFAGLVLKPVLTQEPPILNSSRNPLILPFCPSH